MSLSSPLQIASFKPAQRAVFGRSIVVNKTAGVIDEREAKALADEVLRLWSSRRGNLTAFLFPYDKCEPALREIFTALPPVRARYGNGDDGPNWFNDAFNDLADVGCHVGGTQLFVDLLTLLAASQAGHAVRPTKGETDDPTRICEQQLPERFQRKYPRLHNLLMQGTEDTQAYRGNLRAHFAAILPYIEQGNVREKKELLMALIQYIATQSTGLNTLV